MSIFFSNEKYIIMYKLFLELQYIDIWASNIQKIPGGQGSLTVARS